MMSPLLRKAMLADLQRKPAPRLPHHRRADAIVGAGMVIAASVLVATIVHEAFLSDAPRVIVRQVVK
jgi:hypothetical protein